jgi:aryl-alcohol dehydrogenase-like predicted oxidoreductase
MRIRRLARTELEISAVGVGTWAIGGGGLHWGWGPQDDGASVAAIHRAVELGVNWIDTAPAYGLGCRGERVVGEALAQLSEKPYVFTKCGLYPVEGGTEPRLKAQSVREECEMSLRRLGIEAIDLYQIHWPNPDRDIEEAWATLAELKREGKVRHIGVSNFDLGHLKRVAPIAPVETLQPPYSLLFRDVEADVLPYCEREGIGVLAYSPMASGLLAGAMTRERIAALPPDDFRSHVDFFQEPALTRNLEVAERVKDVGGKHGVSAGAVAVAWTLRHPAVSAAIVGFRRPEQVEAIWPSAAELELEGEDLALLEGDVPDPARVSV